MSARAWIPFDGHIWLKSGLADGFRARCVDRGMFYVGCIIRCGDRWAAVLSWGGEVAGITEPVAARDSFTSLDAAKAWLTDMLQLGPKQWFEGWGAIDGPEWAEGDLW